VHVADVWKWFTPFTSADYTQGYLRKIYESKGYDEPLSNSYKNGDSFSYYIEHGKKFYQQAAVAPYELKPILYFYGVTQLLKACLLTVDTDYPKNAAVLAHGVSARKRKKSRYDFMQDTVQIQKSGLFSYSGKHLFSMESMEGAKLRMDELYNKIPELSPLSERILQQPICFLAEEKGPNLYTVTTDILDSLHVTRDRFYKFLGDTISPVENDNPKQIAFKIIDFTLFLNDINGNKYLPSKKLGYLQIPEVLVHYLLLYNLSMIARYETEWWSILHFERTSIDLPFIHEFLDITEVKFPMMIADWLSTYDAI
jgi:hypothetical protein